MGAPKLSTHERVTLRNALSEGVKRSELDLLVFDLAVDGGRLRTATELEYVLDLVYYFESRESVGSLIDYVIQQRSSSQFVEPLRAIRARFRPLTRRDQRGQ